MNVQISSRYRSTFWRSSWDRHTYIFSVLNYRFELMLSKVTLHSKALSYRIINIAWDSCKHSVKLIITKQQFNSTNSRNLFFFRVFLRSAFTAIFRFQIAAYSRTEEVTSRPPWKNSSSASVGISPSFWEIFWQVPAHILWGTWLLSSPPVQLLSCPRQVLWFSCRLNFFAFP